ncbi:MAG: UDP-N-acetylmuramoyl-L-alanine--D-glutamate ligase, partial [Patescibacteria group bacterium]|nr:UDP-N-acetylmuramoyl-L-alanine--D-glutamate ligase [Patescibacteria group bacterium]
MDSNLLNKKKTPVALINFWKKYHKKKILILGLGKEGMDSFRFFRKIFPDKILGVGDKSSFNELSGKAQAIIKSDAKNRKHLGKNYLKAIRDYDVVVKSPGIPICFPEIKMGFREKKITSGTEIFFDNCPGKIIGITGTKGKSTTASLIYQILQKKGLNAHLVGNIGNPALPFLFNTPKNNIYVYELSSHQLYKLKKSPQIAVFLDIYPDHLDYYKDFKEYVEAKANILLNQTKNDYLIYNSSDARIEKLVKKSPAKKIEFDKYPLENEFKNSKFFLKRRLNSQNIKAAISVAKLFKIPKTIINKSIKEFKPLSHRLEFVGEFKGIRFYDDSVSSIPNSAIHGIRTLGNDVQTLILGGYDKRVDFENLAKEIIKNKIRNLILFPSTGKKIWEEIQK